jgi:hypothetical protein
MLMFSNRPERPALMDTRKLNRKDMQFILNGGKL